MATPENRTAPTEVQWAPDTAYRPTDNSGTATCAMTGFRQREGELVYRGPFIDEFMGNFVIGQDAAEDLARLIGWVDPDTLPDDEFRETRIEMLEQENEELRRALEFIQRRVEETL